MTFSGLLLYNRNMEQTPRRQVDTPFHTAQFLQGLLGQHFYHPADLQKASKSQKGGQNKERQGGAKPEAYPAGISGVGYGFHVRDEFLDFKPVCVQQRRLFGSDSIKGVGKAALNCLTESLYKGLTRWVLLWPWG